MAKPTRPATPTRKGANVRRVASDADLGFWHRPALMNLCADVLYLVAAFMLLGAAWAAVQRMAVLPLRQLVVTTPLQHVAPAQIEQAVRTALAGNFLTVNLDAARVAFEGIPWVRRAEVRKRWPDTIELTIDEHRAVAHWTPKNGSARLVNDRGEIFVAETSMSLPYFSGPEDSPARVLARFAEFNAGVHGIGRHVVAIQLSPREAWRLRLDDGVSIDLGRDQDKQALATRINRLSRTYVQLHEQLSGAFDTIDMRYPNGFAVRTETPTNRAPRAAS
ncbi:MAG: cell division protein FtsQ/DivIB [Rhodocyclaceae bacterium]|jgi:cell division protein FtsQ|nr:cell division protein FtsQ/DivIB [Rhodocyclaceae bacterium]